MSGRFVEQDFSANVTESGGSTANGNPGTSQRPPVPSHVNQGQNPPANPPGVAGSSGTNDAPPQYDELYPATDSNTGHQLQKPPASSKSSYQDDARVSPRPELRQRGENASYYNSTETTGAPMPSGYAPPPPVQQQQHFSPPARPPTQQHYDAYNQPNYAQPQQGYPAHPPPPMQSQQPQQICNEQGNYPHGLYTNYPPPNVAGPPMMVVPVTGGAPVLMVPATRRDERRARRFERREHRYERREERWERRHGGGFGGGFGGGGFGRGGRGGRSPGHSSESD